MLGFSFPVAALSIRARTSGSPKLNSPTSQQRYSSSGMRASRATSSALRPNDCRIAIIFSLVIIARKPAEEPYQARNIRWPTREITSTITISTTAVHNKRSTRAQRGSPSGSPIFPASNSRRFWLFFRATTTRFGCRFGRQRNDFQGRTQSIVQA
jgi:hypothetical protein